MSKEYYGRHLNQKSLFTRMLKSWQLYVLLLPALVYLVIFCYIPMYGVQLAFKDYVAVKGIWGSPWIGLENFIKFFNSYFFWTLIKNTIILSLYSLLIGFPIPIIMALFLNLIRSKVYKRIIQTITYAPNFISTVVVIGMINIFLSPDNGIVNCIIKLLGGGEIFFLGRPEYFRSIYVWSGIWQGAGFSMVIYLAALSTVDIQQHEAASIDGANKLLRIWHIDLPAIMPTIIILFILSLGGIMNVGFEKVYLLQNSANLQTSEVIATYVYKKGLLDGDMGFSTAVGLFNTIINSMLLIVSNYVSRKVQKVSLW